MSQENVEIVRRAFTAGWRKPKPDFATVNELFHPEFVLRSMFSAVEGRDFVGASGFREWLANVNATWESWESEVVNVEAIDPDRVLLPVENRFTSKEGVGLEQTTWFVVTVRDGKVTRAESYRSREDALEAAGLSE
ncbi:MAG: nuclear transport factor 2 family protein [Solirubrobacterales bacterium]